MKKAWQENVFNNFDDAADRYNANVNIQKDIAWKLSELCNEQAIPKGIWLDLGSGTGLLAESLEALNPSQQVFRIDSSKKMIELHKDTIHKQVWDLNKGLPTLPEAPKLIASSFVLHWLKNPSERIKEWFNALEEGGWLALAIPINGSFSEWYQASKKASVPCTALDLPSDKSLLQFIKSKNIRHNKLIQFKQTANNLNSLFKPIVKIGAQASKHHSLKVSEWKRLQKSWSLTTANEVNLTWLIQMVLIEK